MKILFVCTGNICRSLTAELLLERLAERRGLGVEARSCGVAAQRLYQPPEAVWAELAKRGVERRPHAPQLVTRELLGWADLVLTMERGHRDLLLESFPEFTAKTHVLRGWAGLDDVDVEDPMGQSEAVYARSCASIEQALEAALAKPPFKA